MIALKPYQKILFTLLTVGLSLSVSAQTVSRSSNGYEVVIEHELSIDQADGIIEIEAYLGSIVLVGTSASVTRITETFDVEADSEQEAQEMAGIHASRVGLSGRRIQIDETPAVGRDRTLKVEMEAGLRAIVSTLAGDIRVDGGSGSLRLATGAGSVTVVGVSGSVYTTSGAGNVEMERIGGEVTVQLGAGNITLTDIRAGIDVVTGAGDLKIDDVEGFVDATTAGGDIDVSDVNGYLTLSTAGGSIEVESITGDAELSTSGGRIRMVDIDGDVRATTLGGDVEAISIRGEAFIETMAGDIEMYGVTRGLDVISEVGEIQIYVVDASFLESETIEVRAENGDVELHLPRDTRADIRLDLGYRGSLDSRYLSSEFVLENVLRDAQDGSLRRALGRLNGGGGRVAIKTGLGDVILSDRGTRRDRD